MNGLKNQLRWTVTVIIMLLITVSAAGISGCAVLAGAAAGGATGYVAGHEAAEHEHHDHD